MAVTFTDDHGKQHDNIDLQGMLYHEIAAKEGISFRQAINRKFKTRADEPDAFMQFCVSAGLRFKADDDLGIPAANLRDMLNPMAANTNQTGGTYTSAPGVPDSLILFMPALLETVENILQTREDMATNAFDAIVGYRKTIASDRFIQPVIDYGGKKGAEDTQFSRIAQNSRPNVMLSLTASDISRTIPTFALGMEISSKAMLNNSLDMVALPMARMFKKVNYADWIAWIALMVSGDPDGFNTVMDNNTAALSTITAKSLDDTIAAANTLTQLAWLKFLYRNTMNMTKSHMIMDINGLMAVENRSGRPTNVMNNSSDRIDTPFRVIYPAFNSTVDIVVMPEDSGWPAGYIVAIDKPWAIAEVTSSTADYQAVESLVMKRSTEIRVDRGSIRYRQYTDAFDTMRLALS